MEEWINKITDKSVEKRLLKAASLAVKGIGFLFFNKTD